MNFALLSFRMLIWPLHETSETSETIETSETSATNSKQLKFGTLCDTMKKDTTSFNVGRNNYVRFLSISEVKNK